MKLKFKQLLKMMTSYEGTLFTYAFAYSIIAGIAPFLIIAVVFIGGYIYPVDQLIMFLQRYVPADLVVPFVEYLSGSSIDNLWLIISLLVVSVWVASKSIYSFLLLSSEQDGLSVYHFLLRLLAMVYFVLIILGIGVMIFVLGYFPIANSFALPFVILAFFILFYRLLSFKYTAFKDVILGSIFSSVTLSLLGRLFFNYINQYSNYQTIYGPLASLMILLISGFIIAWVIYCGYCINYVFRDQSSEPKQKDYLLSIIDKNSP